MDIIPGFYDSTEDKDFIDDINIKDIKLESLRSKMGIVSQETFLFNRTVKQNIAYCPEHFLDDKIIEATRKANAHKFILKMDWGYDSVFGERGIKLAGGQKQQLTIAGALLKNPEIMIFDEATSALDKGTIVQKRTHENLLLDNNGLYKKLYDMQFRNGID